ncbi:MAG TPA: hypothetical protein VNF73_15245 [Candidatus Saccharimonadales bacterium]|nr:hypothetical protein [Candidatus Saccharimonadales bacterium]
MPAGFQAVSVTFASPTEGWVLGSVGCGTSHCLAIVHTLDAGRTWATIPAPPTTLSPDRGWPGATGGVGGLRFADPLDGWAFGPELWATHDGGQSWARLTIPGHSGSVVVALEAAHDLVHAVLYDGKVAFRIASSRVGTDTWRLSSLVLPFGAGPVAEVQLVLSGGAGWVLQNDRTVVNGARLVGGSWRAWQPACADVVGPAYLAASSAEDLVAACDLGLWSTPAGGHLFVSHDGGLTFVETGTRVPGGLEAEIASPGTSTVIVAGGAGTRSVLVGSFDGGRTWTTVFSGGAAASSDLGFTTPTQGVVVTNDGRLLMTRDGGRSWAQVRF